MNCVGADEWSEGQGGRRGVEEEVCFRKPARRTDEPTGLAGGDLRQQADDRRPCQRFIDRQRRTASRNRPPRQRLGCAGRFFDTTYQSTERSSPRTRGAQPWTDGAVEPTPGRRLADRTGRARRQMDGQGGHHRQGPTGTSRSSRPYPTTTPARPDRNRCPARRPGRGCAARCRRGCRDGGRITGGAAGLHSGHGSDQHLGPFGTCRRTSRCSPHRSVSSRQHPGIARCGRCGTDSAERGDAADTGRDDSPDLVESAGARPGRAGDRVGVDLRRSGLRLAVRGIRNRTGPAHQLIRLINCSGCINRSSASAVRVHELIRSHPSIDRPGDAGSTTK